MYNQTLVTHNVCPCNQAFSLMLSKGLICLHSCALLEEQFSSLCFVILSLDPFKQLVKAITCILQNHNILYCVHKRPPVAFLLKQMSPPYTFPSHFFKLRIYTKYRKGNLFSWSVKCKVQHDIGSGITQLVQQLAMGWTVQNHIPVGGEIFRTCTDWL